MMLGEELDVDETSTINARINTKWHTSLQTRHMQEWFKKAYEAQDDGDAGLLGSAGQRDQPPDGLQLPVQKIVVVEERVGDGGPRPAAGLGAHYGERGLVAETSGLQSNTLGCDFIRCLHFYCSRLLYPLTLRIIVQLIR